MPTERIEKLGFDERWIHAGLKAIDPPGGFLSVEVDMTQPDTLRSEMRQRGVNITYTHLLVRAVAKAFAMHPELHKLTAGRKRLLSDSVDVCLSVASDRAVTPVVILRNAQEMTLETIAREVAEGAQQARTSTELQTRVLNRWGWLVPGSRLRQSLVRLLLANVRYRRKVSGTIQLTTVPTADLFVPFLFNTAGVISAGRVRKQVVAVGNDIAIRPILNLACCFDHKVWNGVNTATILNTIKDELERTSAPSL